MLNRSHNQLPGVGTSYSWQHREFLRQNQGLPPIYLSHVGVIDGDQSRDPGNTSNLDVLRAGLMMGIITSTGKWAPAIVGALESAYTSGGTELSVTAAQAVELDRLVGQAGTNELVCIGAPTATGTIAVTAFTHSAINTSTGAITVTSLGVNKHAGSYIAVNDGRYTPRGFIGEGYGVKVTDETAASVDVQLGRLLVGGFLKTDNVINYPDSANTGLISWLKSNIAGLYLWDDDFGF